MKTIAKYIIISFIFICYNSLQAQISTSETPVSFGLNMEQKYDAKSAKTMPNIDIDKLTAEDEINEKSGASYHRFGYPHKVDYSLENSGEWFILQNGDKMFFIGFSINN